ncbi:aminotransferase class I/II-fold pyridoxal phosphate-dependent enzyme [Cupriavidus basilensis]|uniref:aminotransferase class I/II-fold pyridoxal phosphate-dependent enzyme n=1 Tax=Cupriavidus basilensis TaxID=68895 RepID=UPI0039F6ABE0
MISLSKSIGLEGGAISANAEYIDALEVLSGTLIFTAAIQPPTACAAATIIERLQADPEIIDDDLRRTLQFRQTLLELDLPLNEEPSFITSD